jgi:membrane protease YdiL (CAAX protease family)
VNARRESVGGLVRSTALASSAMHAESSLSHFARMHDSSALYQTVLLGLGFGVAYLEGGLLAAFVAHAAWNLLQLAG